MHLRSTQPADFETFYRLRVDGFRAHVEQVFGRWLEDEQRSLAVKEYAEHPPQIVELDGEPIGYVVVVRATDHWFLDEIVIDAGHRNRGLGTQILRETMAAARVAALPVRLSVLHVNPAQRFYARLGFRVTRIEHPRIKMEWP